MVSWRVACERREIGWKCGGCGGFTVGVCGVWRGERGLLTVSRLRFGLVGYVVCLFYRDSYLEIFFFMWI